MAKEINTNLYRWLFTFNPYRQEWYACLPEDLNDVYNGNIDTNKNIFKSKDKDTLVSFISEGKHLVSSNWSEIPEK